MVLAASEAFYQLSRAAHKSVQMPRSQHAKPLPKAGPNMRLGAWVVSVNRIGDRCGADGVPVDWNGIAQSAGAFGCPNSRHLPSPVKKPAKPEPEVFCHKCRERRNQTRRIKNGSDSQPSIIKPIAERCQTILTFPVRLGSGSGKLQRGYDDGRRFSDVGYFGRHPGRIPERFIDGLPNRQLPAGGGCVSAGHRCRPQWQCGGGDASARTA